MGGGGGGELEEIKAFGDTDTFGEVTPFCSYSLHNADIKIEEEKTEQKKII